MDWCGHDGKLKSTAEEAQETMMLNTSSPKPFVLAQATRLESRVPQMRLDDQIIIAHAMPEYAIVQDFPSYTPGLRATCSDSAEDNDASWLTRR